MCEFCNGSKKKIPLTSEGYGIKTMAQSTKAFYSFYKEIFGEDAKKFEPDDYIMLDESNTLWCQTSSREYHDMGIKINYCPFCGRKL